MRINTNIASLVAQANNSQVNMKLNNSLEKLSSGLRINKAADDASGMSIADKLRTQASSIGQGIANANSASALIQIADKAMAEQSNILDIVKTKLLQAATSTTSAEGREAVRKDISKLLEQLDNISVQTTYNGVNLLDTQNKSFDFQVGEKSTDIITTTTAYAVNTTGLGASESVSKDVDSILTFGTVDSSLALFGKTDITVSNASTATSATQMAAITINNDTSAIEFGATLSSTASGVTTTSFSLEAQDVTRLKLTTTDGSAADAVVITTDDAALIATLDGITSGGNYESLTGSNGTYHWRDAGASFTQGGDGVLNFGTGIDISKLTFSNVSMTQIGSQNSEITVVTEEDVKITQLGEVYSALAIDSSTVGTATLSSAAITATLHGKGSSNADGIRFSDEVGSTLVLAQGTASVQVDQSTSTVVNASVAIGTMASGETAGTTSNGEMVFSIDAKSVEKISMTTGGSVSLSTTDSDMINVLSGIAKYDADLTEVNPGSYLFAGASTTVAMNAVLDFGSAGVDISKLTFSGVTAASESIFIQTEESVSVTKVGSLNDQYISIEAASGTTAGNEILKGVTTDTSSISGSLSGLKALGEDELTAVIANDYMATIDAAMTQLNTVRSDFGSTQNQLASATRNMMVTQVNIKAAESVIRDVDYAAESANFNKQNIISQAGTYAMSQANNVQQNIMRLLQ